MTKVELHGKAALDLIHYLEFHVNEITRSEHTLGELKSVLNEVLAIPLPEREQKK